MSLIHIGGRIQSYSGARGDNLHAAAFLSVAVTDDFSVINGCEMRGLMALPGGKDAQCKRKETEGAVEEIFSKMLPNIPRFERAAKE